VLGYQTPEQFEQTVTPGKDGQYQALSFLRHKEIFQSDVLRKKPPEGGSPRHHLDESPTDYSLGGLVSTRARLRFASRGDCKVREAFKEEELIERRVCSFQFVSAMGFTPLPQATANPVGRQNSVRLRHTICADVPMFRIDNTYR
jgi:hypothetical protein